jgi:hypothetical protein
VGGEFAAAGDVLLDPLREAVTTRAVPRAGGDVPVLAGELGDRADILGALALARRKTQIELA